jgi:hypothetical protein
VQDEFSVEFDASPVEPFVSPAPQAETAISAQADRDFELGYFEDPHLEITAHHEPISRKWNAPPQSVFFVTRPDVGLWAVSTSGFEDARGHLWHRQLHIFLYPFYYIEYGIAQLGALQVWANSKRDRAKALRDYQSALALGGSRPLPELFSAAGCRFDFSAKTVEPLANLVQTELTKLN